MMAHLTWAQGSCRTVSRQVTLAVGLAPYSFVPHSHSNKDIVRVQFAYFIKAYLSTLILSGMAAIICSASVRTLAS